MPLKVTERYNYFALSMNFKKEKEVCGMLKHYSFM